MKRILSVIIVLIFAMTLLAGCGKTDNRQPIDAKGDDDVTKAILNEFNNIAAFPRGENDEEEVSDYLKKWAQQHGFKVKQDSLHNIIFNVPATKGYENAPLTVLQAHMDMVIAVDPDKDFTPETESITVIRDGNYIKGDGTSLGADDGVGIAIIQYIAENNKEHGPLRVIITTDEECNQEGAKYINSRYIKDVDYLINVDGEKSDLAINSTSSCIRVTGKMKPKKEYNPFNGTFKITVEGSKGGNSGECINKNHMNSIIELIKILDNIKNAKIDFRIVSLNGGIANNAIPESATCKIACDSSYEDALKYIMEESKRSIESNYKEDNPDAKVKFSKCNTVHEAMTKKITDRIVAFGTEVNNGVNTMSARYENLVQSSANLGVFVCDTEEIYYSQCLRSSSVKTEDQLITEANEISLKYGFTPEISFSCLMWPEKKDSKLAEIAKEQYMKQNGKELTVMPQHIGNECSWFLEIYPDIDVISIGPDILNDNSTTEKCDVRSIPKVKNLIDGILGEIAQQ